MTAEIYESSERTREILNEVYFDNFKFWQREKNLGVIKENQSIKDLAIRDNRSLRRNPFEPVGALLDKDSKKEWLEEMENPIVLESEIPNAKSKLLIEHKDDIENAIDTSLPENKSKEVSYISKSELEEMLSSHMEQVQTLMNDHKEAILSLNEQKTSLGQTLKTYANNFKKSLQEKIQSQKTATKETIGAVREAGINKLKGGVIKINESLKGLSHYIDKKVNHEQESNGFHWYQSKNKDLNVENVPENVAFIDRSNSNGDIVAYREPLDEQQIKDNELEPYNKEQDKDKDKAKVNNKSSGKQNNVEMEM